VTLALWFDMMLPGDPHLTSIYAKMPLGLSLTIVLYGYLQCPIAMLMEKVNWRMYVKLLLFPVFFLSWWPIAFYAFFTQNNKTWSHTQHTRVIRLEEVQGKQM